MKKLDKIYYRDIIYFTEENYKNTVPLFFLKNNLCEVYTEEDFHKGFLIVPAGELKDLYLSGQLEQKQLKDFLVQLKDTRTLLCDTSLKSVVMNTGIFRHVIKNIIYSFSEKPADFLSVPDDVKKLSTEDRTSFDLLPRDASFIYKNFLSSERFLKEGLSCAIFDKNRIISCAGTYAISDRYADICVYTVPWRRKKQSSYKCATALIKELFLMNKWPTWTADESHEPSRKLAEKLGMVPVDELCCFY
ncbi:MAG: GNAT family N-acetyltransferase [Candidatus Eremiobacterota bacterium]